MHEPHSTGLSFVLAASNHGPMIVNRLDYHQASPDSAYGVGGQILQTGSYQPTEIQIALNILSSLRKCRGDGIVAIDCGANIGVHTVEWARHMVGWGDVLAIEAQDRVFYALAGNIALNNCFNASAIWAAVSNKSGTMEVPKLNHQTPTSFGSLELRKHPKNEAIGQEVDYVNTTMVLKTSIDDMDLKRVDFIKLDIQRMELEAIEGAQRTIHRSRPIMIIEKTDVGEDAIKRSLSAHDYLLKAIDSENVLAIHRGDSVLKEPGVAEWIG